MVQEPVCNCSSSMMSCWRFPGNRKILTRVPGRHQLPQSYLVSLMKSHMSSNIQLNYFKQTNDLIALSSLMSELFHRNSCKTSLFIHMHSDLGHTVLVLPHLHVLVHFSLCKVDWEMLQFECPHCQRCSGAKSTFKCFQICWSTSLLSL